jgi:hypothetical protein
MATCRGAVPPPKNEDSESLWPAVPEIFRETSRNFSGISCSSERVERQICPIGTRPQGDHHVVLDWTCHRRGAAPRTTDFRGDDRIDERGPDMAQWPR